MNILEELATYLESQNYTSVYRSFLPDTPDNAIALYTNGGPESDIRYGYDERDIQIRVRNTDAQASYTTAESLYGALHGLYGIALSGDTWLVVCRALQSGPLAIGKDTNERYEYTINLRLRVRNITKHRE